MADETAPEPQQPAGWPVYGDGGRDRPTLLASARSGGRLNGTVVRITAPGAALRGVDMPPKRGNPALTDQQILDIIAYLRTLEE